MKTMINFSTSPDDTSRYTSSEDLQGFYTSFDCDGLELMPLEDPDTSLIRPEMVIGVHLCCISDWMEKDPAYLLKHYHYPRRFPIYRSLESSSH